MGLFNIFKSPEKKQLDKYLRDIQSKAFPNGKSQMEHEVKQVSALLLFKFSASEIKELYLHATTMYFIHDKDEQKIISSLKAHSDKISTNNASAIFQFLHEKFTSKRENLKKGTMNFSDSERLFLVCKGALIELQNNYKNLSNYGKFETILLGAFIALNTYKNKYPGDNSAVEQSLISQILKQGANYIPELSNHKLLEILVERFEYYLSEIENIYLLNDSNLGKIIFYLYLSDLSFEKQIEFKVGNGEDFKAALKQTIAWIDDNVKKI